MGVLAEVEAAAPARIEHVRIVSPLGLDITIPFADHLPAEDAYALVLPRFTFDDLVRSHAVQRGVEYAGRVSVDRIERAGDRITGVQGTTPDGPIRIEAQHVVLAVGANMGLLEREGFIHRNPRMMRAARAYYQNASVLTNRYDFYFDLELLPGYGWVFPTGDGRANVGAGTLPVFWSTRRTAQSLLAGFVKRRAREGLLAHAEQDGPVRGYPLRIDFPAERVAGSNWILAGESTGLVNPLTGEGIDLAMESGLLGAEVLHEDILAGRASHVGYQQALWRRFASLFSGLRALRDILVNPIFMDYVLWQMRQYAFLTGRVVNIAQGIEPPQRIFHPLFILQFFMPFSPGLVVNQVGRLFRNGHRQA
jgi:flavin-dependent dehydrogenase